MLGTYRVSLPILDVIMAENNITGNYHAQNDGLLNLSFYVDDPGKASLKIAGEDAYFDIVGENYIRVSLALMEGHSISFQVDLN